MTQKIFITYFFFAIGFVILIKGADILIDAASSLANKLGVSDLVIGLTVVSFGSSAPELLVNITASSMGRTDLAIGNVLGSNIINILLGLGIAAAICPIHLKKSTIWREIPFSLMAIFVVALMANDNLIFPNKISSISRLDGLILLLLFAVFLYYIYGLSTDTEVEKNSKHYTVLVSVLMIIGGLIGLTLGGKWIVEGATLVALKLGASEAFIGLTIVAIGTSLPEIVTSAVAASKKKSDIAVGNIVGSNIFNILWVLGLSSIIRTLDFRPVLNVDIAMVIFATAFLFVSLFVGKKYTIGKREGIGFIAAYAIYTAYLIYRG